MCLVPGCTIPGARTSLRNGRLGQQQYCPTHHRTLYRNGHPEQKAILQRDMRPYRKLIGSKLTPEIEHYWELLWKGLQDYAHEVLHEANMKPTSRHLKDACRQILLIAAEATPVDVGTTIVALHLLREDRPSSFKSDQAMVIQVSNLVRRLAPMECLGIAYDKKAQKSIPKYMKYLPFRTSKALGDLLINAYAPSVAGFVGILRAKEKARQDALERAKVSFRELQKREYEEELKRQLVTLGVA